MRKSLPAKAGALLRGWIALAAFLLLQSLAGEIGNTLTLPAVGDAQVTVLDATLVEYTVITTKEPDPAPPREWNIIGPNFALQLPDVSQFEVRINGVRVDVAELGFKRRPIYAPLRKRDLRILNAFYLRLGRPIAAADRVSVNGRDASAGPLHLNPAIHVNQVGYVPGLSKKAMIGYYLGSMGEMHISTRHFDLIDLTSGEVAFSSELKSRPDSGWSYEPGPYQEVMEADFTIFDKPGEYVLQVPSMGASLPFFIDSGTGAAFARTLALGLYHQRCGTANAWPATRFEHQICHSSPAEVPTLAFEAVNRELSAMSSNYRDNPAHIAPQLKDVSASLYPFVNSGPLDVSGGHHDAGDYSKYTINSAGLVHHLMFAVDSLNGVGDLDNLGIPETGDGIPDLLQEAKWEADFLTKMQDADGGFYFLVYPRDREYEDDVLPDHGDPQVVFPKTTAATAAAIGALAEAASSPRMKAFYPAAAAGYLARAKEGWSFLESAIARFGKDGAYQKITHYGNEFMHDDELAWASSALFVATGETRYHDRLREWYDPSDPNTRRWTWWRLFEGYGCAARTYAFAARSGRLSPSQLDPAYLLKCESEILAAGDDIARFAEGNAYGTSFPDPNKSFRTAGWYFSSERSFDMAAAFQILPKQRYLDAIVSNMNYEGGCNPVNVTYITGLGWKRSRDVVHQYAQNDTRILPPNGLPIGNIQTGFAWLENYKQELGALCFPPDGAATNPYPFYDRWGDSFNTTTEFVVVDQARSLAALAFLMGRTSAAASDGRNSSGRISGVPASLPAGEKVTVSLDAVGVDLSHARIVWEARDQEPFIGSAYSFAPKNPGEQWIEVEALRPDGRRVYGRATFTATARVDQSPNRFQSAAVQVSSEFVAVYHLDEGLSDATGANPPLTLSGAARLDAENLGWMTDRAGRALHFSDEGDSASAFILIPAGAEEVTVEAMVFVTGLKGANRGNARLLSLRNNWNASLEWVEDAYTGGHLRGGTQFDLSGPALSRLSSQEWHHLSLTISRDGYSARIDGQEVARLASPELANWSRTPSQIEVGNFDGWIDELVVRKRRSSPVVRPRMVHDATGVSIRWSAQAGKRYYICSVPLLPSDGSKQIVETVTASSTEGVCRISPNAFRGFFVVEPAD